MPAEAPYLKAGAAVPDGVPLALPPAKLGSGERMKFFLPSRSHRKFRAGVATAVGAFATGAFAVGAFAIGALAIGRLAIRAIAAEKAAIKSLRIDELTVNRLSVKELTVSKSMNLPTQSPPGGAAAV